MKNDKGLSVEISKASEDIAYTLAMFIGIVIGVIWLNGTTGFWFFDLPIGVISFYLVGRLIRMKKYRTYLIAKLEEKRA
jgi:hypothetical protein